MLYRASRLTVPSRLHKMAHLTGTASPHTGVWANTQFPFFLSLVFRSSHRHKHLDTVFSQCWYKDKHLWLSVDTKDKHLRVDAEHNNILPQVSRADHFHNARLLGFLLKSSLQFWKQADKFILEPDQYLIFNINIWAWHLFQNFGFSNSKGGHFGSSCVQ